MSDLIDQLQRSVYIVAENTKLRRLVDILQAENATLRQRLHERAAFDLAADGLPLSRPQAG